MAGRVGKTFGALIVALVAAEIVMRVGFGLGDPPLYLRHPTIEYMLAPRQTTRTLGNAFIVNAWGMRSGAVTAQRAELAREWRLLVVGDSVVNGGVVIAHDQLATTRLAPRIARHIARPIYVANISAGGWGPHNQLAYIETFGTFEADVLLIVASSHDYHDVPTFDHRDLQALRMSKPLSAVTDVLFHHLPQLLWPRRPTGDASRTQPEGNTAAAMHSLVGRARANGLRVCAALHQTRSEIMSGQLDAGGAELRALFAESGVPVTETAREMQAALAAGETLFSDNIHLTANGQRHLATALMTSLKHCNALGERVIP